MRFWVKQFKDNRMLADTTIEDFSTNTRTQKVFNALEEACLQFDLSKPIWLSSNINDFKKNAKTRFTKDSFIDEVNFDYLEFHVLEEDY